MCQGGPLVCVFPPHKQGTRKAHVGSGARNSTRLTGPIQSQARKRSPRDRLEKVVAARDGVEPVPARDLTDFGPLGAQTREGQVGLQVGQFGKLRAHATTIRRRPSSVSFSGVRASERARVCLIEKGKRWRTAQSAVHPYNHASDSRRVPLSAAAPFQGPYSGAASKTPERPQ